MSPHRSSYRLRITADPDSTFLARVSDVLAGLDFVPDGLEVRREAGATGFLLLATLVVSATARQIDLLARKLGQMTLVHTLECRPVGDESRPRGVDEGW